MKTQGRLTVVGRSVAACKVFQSRYFRNSQRLSLLSTTTIRLPFARLAGVVPNTSDKFSPDGAQVTPSVGCGGRAREVERKMLHCDVTRDGYIHVLQP
jgi:hypothetical protein